MDKIVRTGADDAEGGGARLESIPGANVEDIGTEKLELRGGDDRDVMIATVSADAARESQLTIVNRPEEEGGTTEVREVEENPRLAALKQQYESLSTEDRTCQGKLRSWEEVLSAIPDMSDFLAGVETIEQAQVYFLNEGAQLVIGNGGPEPLDGTFGGNYHKSRSRATRISYVNSEGSLVVVNGDDTEIPFEARILTERGLILLEEEYIRINKGQFEKNKSIWTESGKNPSVARDACWDDGKVDWYEDNPRTVHGFRGSRHVLRVNLKL